MLFNQLITITALAAVASATALGNGVSRRWAKDDNANQAACFQKDQVLLTAIQLFCETNNPYDNLNVPSDYAKAGQVRTNVVTGQVRVKIESHGCPESSPRNDPTDFTGEWVPREYCSSQFWHICAKGNNLGRGTGNYGFDQCQRFVIEDA